MVFVWMEWYNESMIFAIIFFFGLVFGSFGYVLALRYDGDHFLLDPKIVGGRSYCPHCHKTLRWFELIPLVSFLVQRGRCRSCNVRIGFIYPAIEISLGFLFVFIAMRVQDLYGIALGTDFGILVALWIAFFFALFLLSIIDIRLGIIPDEINLFLAVIALSIIGFTAMRFSPIDFSLLGEYSILFGLANTIWINHLVGAALGVFIFGGLVAITRGNGMGMGDAKLAVPLGFLFGWPGILFLSAFSFIVGAIVGLFFIAFGKKTMKSAVPFGPFLVLGSLFVFFYGFGFVNWYFHLMGI